MDPTELVNIIGQVPSLGGGSPITGVAFDSWQQDGEISEQSRVAV